MCRHKSHAVDQKFAMQEMNVTKLPLEVCRLLLLKINTLQNTTQSPSGGEVRLPGLSLIGRA